MAPRSDIPAGAELRFAWFAEDQLGDLDMFPDTAARARRLFARLVDPAGVLVPAPSPAGVEVAAAE